MIDTTILLPVYNSIEWISECLASIDAQTYKNFKIWINDDGCTDGTSKILEEYAKAHNNVFINKQIHSKYSYIDGLNQCINECDTEFIIRMDSDDIMKPNRIESQIIFLKQHPEVSIYTESADIFKSNGKIILGKNTGEIKEIVLSDIIKQRRIEIVNPNTCYRINDIRKYNIQYKHEYLWIEDHAFWLDCLKNNLKIFIGYNNTFKYRLRNNSMSCEFQHRLVVEKLSKKMFDSLEKEFIKVKE